MRPEYDHIADATVASAAVRRPPERPACRSRFAPRPPESCPLPLARRRAYADRRPGRGSAPRIRPHRRRDCHLRRRAPAARAAGPAPPLRNRGRSCTSTGSAPCSCGLSSVQGLCALIAGGVPPSAGPAPCLRGPSSGQGQCAPNTTTPPTRLSPPPPCAGHQSGRPGAAASRRGAILFLHRLNAVLLRAVLRARAVRPDRRRRATFRWPGAVPTRTAIMGGQPGGGSAPILIHRRRALLCRPCAVFASILVRAGPGALRPDYDSNFDCHLRRRAPATPMAGPAPPPHAWVVLALPPAQRGALSGRRPGKGSAPRSPDAFHLPLARSWAVIRAWQCALSTTTPLK